ncbi:MAG: hypothetical protein JW860_05830 [Sedimentisphaerales bacterium]|nr:hypothetical protein [Sedimentisphaerales bacterium]
MSTLAKVFALLVSALAIFICGIVVTFVSNTQNWKIRYEQQKTIAEAAQAQAVAANIAMSEARARSDVIIAKIRENIKEVHKVNNDLDRRLNLAEIESATYADNSETAIQTVRVLRETIQNMYEAQMALQKELDQDRANMIAAQTQVIELTRNLNGLQVENDQLKSIRKRQLENIYQLEEENASLRQKIDTVTLASRKLSPGGQVTLTEIKKTGVPIRGEITDIEGNQAAISVGSSSGVRQDTKFSIYRNDKFLGDLKVTYVEPTESVGLIDNLQGTVVPGDRVTTGF